MTGSLSSTGYISSARRALRLPLRCDARIEVAGIEHEAYTDDIGPGGCLLVTPIRLDELTRLRLILGWSGATSLLAVGAEVAWRERGPARRHGLAFDEGDHPAIQAWIDQFAEHHTRLLLLDRVPDRLLLAAEVYASRTASPLTHFGDEKTVLLRVGGGHAMVAELCAVLGPNLARARRALFSLLRRGELTLDPPDDAGRPPRQGADDPPLQAMGR